MSVTVSPDGKTIASAGETIKLWDLATGQFKRHLDGHSSAIYSVRFSHDGQRIASSGVDRTARVWQVDTGKSLQILNDHTNLVMGVEFNGTDSELASASLDGTVKLWKAP
jgi:WD40 repeat protein